MRMSPPLQWRMLRSLAQVNRPPQVCRAQKANAAPKDAVMPTVHTPQDMVKVFAETQKNMMELNR